MALRVCLLASAAAGALKGRFPNGLFSVPAVRGRGTAAAGGNDACLNLPSLTTDGKALEHFVLPHVAITKKLMIVRLWDVSVYRFWCTHNLVHELFGSWTFWHVGNLVPGRLAHGHLGFQILRHAEFLAQSRRNLVYGYFNYFDERT